MRCGVDVVAQRAQVDRVVVVRLDVAADSSMTGSIFSTTRREDELVAPDGVPAEFTLVRLDALVDEAGGRAAETSARR